MGTNKQWGKPQVKDLGSVEQVILGGGGKLSLTGGDPGEARKERGNEP